MTDGSSRRQVQPDPTKGVKPRSTFRRKLDKRYRRTRAFVRDALYPVYKALGIRSVLAPVIPGYRQVTKSPGGVALVGNLRGVPTDSPIIGLIGDYGSGKTPSYEVRDMVVAEGAQAIVTLGDNVYTEIGYQVLVGNVYGDYIQEGAFFPATGNHDYSEGRGIALFDRYFSFLEKNRWYSVTLGPIEFFLLDSQQALTHPDVMAAQIEWLEAAARRSTAPFRVVVVHHPPHSARNRSQLEFRLPYRDWGIQLVLSGHDHTLQHLEVDGVHYVVNGVGGGSLHYFDEILEGTVYRLDNHFGAAFVQPHGSTLDVWLSTVDHGEVHRFQIDGHSA